MLSLDPGDKGEKIDDLLAQLQWLATLGFTEAHGRVPRVWETERLALIGREIVPAAAKF
jgi:hypothetical protein